MTKNINLMADMSTSSANTARFKNYSQTLTDAKALAESFGFDFNNGYGAIISDAHSREALVETLTQPLRAKIVDLHERKRMASIEDQYLLNEAIDIANEDLAFVESRLAKAAEMHAESYFAGAAKPYLQQTLPYQYLESIANNARHVVPFKQMDKPAIARVRRRRYVKVGNEEFLLPDALKEASVMGKILGESQKTFTVKIVLSDIASTNNKTNLITLAGDSDKCVAPVGGIAGLVKGQDFLVNVAYVTKIKHQTGGDIELGKSNTTQIHNQTRGKFAVTAQKGGVNSGNPVFVSGVLDFATGDICLSAATGVQEVEITGAISAANMRNVVTSYTRKEDHIIQVDQRINMGLAYDKEQLAAYFSLDNIDGIVESTAIIYDVAAAVKDQYVFNRIGETLADLEAAKLASGVYQDNDLFKHEVELNPKLSNGGDGTVYRPTDEISYRQKMIPEVMAKTATDISNKFQSRKGMTTVFYGHPQVTRLIPEFKTIISKDENYAGVEIDCNLFSGVFGNERCRVVSTLRAKYDNNEASNDLIAVPRSGSENQETFTFYQWFSMIDTDGTSYRNPTNPLLPSLTYIDTFTADCMHGVIGKTTIKKTK